MTRHATSPDDCGRHHWHVTGHGWQCCGCTYALGPADRPPMDEAAECRWPDEHPEESITAWLEAPEATE